MTTLAVSGPPAVGHLDIASLRRVFLALAFILAIVAPFTPDPLAFGVGAFVPWILLSIAGTPTLPAALVFYLLWQWVQVFARALLSMVEGESMARSVSGPWVLDAYWYMTASLVMLALAIRLVLGSLKPPAPREATAHLAWGPIELFQFYLIAFVGSVMANYFRGQVPALDQPMDALARIKVVALFMLFVCIFTSRRGYTYLLAAIVLELVIGFSGLLGDFRSVFIFLFIAALAARIRWTGTTSLIAGTAAIFFVVLGLFWTSIKADYREVATGYTDTQWITAPIEVRLGYVAGRVASAGDINWSDAAYTLLQRVAYVDITGQVIGVKLASPEQVEMRQWSDALAHVFQPRFLFPGKAALSDTEVYMRLARADTAEAVRAGTSISVGYMAENYVDLGFPGMLAGVFAIGVVIAGVCRYFMTIRAPWVVREGTVLAIVYSVGGTGVEMSLPKLVGAVVMGFLVYALLAKFFYPLALRWLGRRASAHRHKEQMRQRAKSRSASRSL